MPIVLPHDRPQGLHLRGYPTGTQFWRLEATDPAAWTWAGFPAPKYRFDPTSGAFRSRYAATSQPGAARERYDDTGRFVEAGHAEHFLVILTCARPFRYLDLRNEKVLDLLGLDDRVSTTHEEEIWTACHDLADFVHGWWGQVDGIVYRSRTTPQTSSNVAFWSTDGLNVVGEHLVDCAAVLDDLILRHGFTVDFDYP
jgi:hypothetical protein